MESVEDMILTAGLAAFTGRLRGPGIGVVSISGGACDIIADHAEACGAVLPEFSEATCAALAKVMPTYGTVQNPLDVTGAAMIDPTLFTSAIDAIADDPAVGAVATIYTLPWIDRGVPFHSQPHVAAIGTAIARSPVPVVYVNQALQPITSVSRAVLDAGGVPHAIGGLGEAVRALARIGWWSEAVAELQQAPAAQATRFPVALFSEPGERWSEYRARGLLESVGIPVVPARLVHNADEAAEAAAELAGAGAVALKAVSPDIVHKSDVGAVRLGVLGARAVRDAYVEVAAAAAAADGAGVEGVLVSPMRTGGIELLVGVARDAQWGPMLAVALGGVFVELLEDSVIAPLPVGARVARGMLERLRAAAVLRGARGREPADLDALAEVVARIGQLALELGERLEALEVNPLWVDGRAIEALDAFVSWSAA